jgi:hypothetical protein
MEEQVQASITADSLRAREEWRQSFPGAKMVSEETADEGVGHGFDGLDPSAMLRASFRTSNSWADVLAWYRVLLAASGWLGTGVHSDEWSEWWEWTSPARPGERFLVMDRSRVPENLKAWAQPQDTLLFEVMFTARTNPVEPAPSA